MKHPNKSLLVMAAALASGLILTASVAEAKPSKKEVKKANNAIVAIHKADKDHDGLSETLEKALKTKFKQGKGSKKALNTNSSLDDTDEDGLTDGVEVHLTGTDPLVDDTDSDGLHDGDEIMLGTEPLVEDTDGDGWADFDELAYETDPTDGDTNDNGISDGTDGNPGEQDDVETFDIVGMVTDEFDCQIAISSTGETFINAEDAVIENDLACADLLGQEIGVMGAVVDGTLVAEEIYFTDVISSDEDEVEQCAISYEDEEWADEWMEADGWDDDSEDFVYDEEEMKNHKR
jgi:hypothetical protein